MKTTTIQVVSIEPNAGMHLKNINTGVIAEGKVFLGENASANDYVEVTHEEYLQYKENIQKESENIGFQTIQSESD